MNDIEYLELEDVLHMVRLLEIGPIRDLGLLDSSVARPRSGTFAEDFYPTLELKAAALLHSLAKNPALVDGNKRLAWLATVVFCDLNGAAPDLSDDEAFQLVWDAASSDLDLTRISQRLRCVR